MGTSALKTRGVALSEYGIILALILLIGIGALMLLGKSVSSVFSGMVVGWKPSEVASPNLAAIPAAVNPSEPAPANPAGPVTGESAGGPVAGPGNVLPRPTAGQQRVCLENGWCANIPVVKEQTLTDTTGSLGVKLTYQFADVLSQIAEQVAAMPDADPGLVNLITVLANHGHTLGDKEAAVHGLCQPGQQCADPAAAGNPDSGMQVNDDSSTSTNSTQVRSALQAIATQAGRFSAANDAVQSYLATHPNAIPPEMQSLLKFEATEILNIGNAYDPRELKTALSNGAADVNWNYAYNPQITHQSANTICQNGGNQSKCIQ